MKKYFFSFGSLFTILVLSYWSIAPLFIQGFFPMHDDTQPSRVHQMAKALTDGMFPVRWVPDLGYGYGYPIFSFYSPLPYYLGAGFIFLGADALFATKMMIATGILLSGIGMYFLAKIFWGRSGAVVAALLYVYAPYHAVNVYVRGAVGELFGYAFIPLVFYGIIRSYQEGKFRYVAVAGISFAALLSSHNLTGLMVTPFVVLLLLVLTIFSLKKTQKASFYFMYLSLVVGLVLSAFYWVPALLEMGYTNVISQVGGAADFREHYICTSQLWESQWGFGGSARGCVDGMSYRVGKVHLLLIAAAFLLLPFIYKRDKKSAFVIAIGVVFLLTSLFFSLDYSKVVWKAFPVLSFIQYPWRFLTLIAFFSSFLGGVFIWFLLQRISFFRKNIILRVFMVAAFATGIIFFYQPLFVPQTIIPRTAATYVDQNALRWYVSRISDEYLPAGFLKPQTMESVPNKKFSVASGKATLSAEQIKTQKASVQIDAETQSKIKINVAYFPAWQVTLDGSTVPYKIEKNGMSILVPEGKHSIVTRYVSTKIEQTADTISLIGILGLVTGIILSKRRSLL